MFIISVICSISQIDTKTDLKFELRFLQNLGLVPAGSLQLHSRK